MSKRSTIKEIAEKANVSTATVSYVLNSTPGKSISEETRQKVLSLAKELDYVPNYFAKQLKSGRSNCIAVRLSNSLMTARYYTMLQGIRSYLEPRGYSMLLCRNAGDGSMAECIRACRDGRADGLIYISATGKGILPKDRELLEKEHIPFSAIDCMGSDPKANSIVYDYFASSRMRMDYLLEQGFRKFFYIRSSVDNFKSDQREDGVMSVLRTMPQVSVKVFRLSELDEAWYARYNSVEGNVDEFSNAPLGSIYASSLRKIFSTSDVDTAFIAYSREIQQAISTLLFQQHLLDGTERTENWYRRSVSYHFAHDECGKEAARSLLNNLNGDKKVRKLSLQPIIEPIDPAYY